MDLNMYDTFVIGYTIGIILGATRSLDMKSKYIFLGIGIVGLLWP